MSVAVKFHHFIDQHNVLKAPTNQINECSKNHRSLYKVALIANHIFRAASMVGFMMILSFSSLANHTICLAGSLFYRLTVEDNCAYKFALPACAGSMAFITGQSALMDMINGAFFASLATFANAFTALLPLCGFFAYVALTVSYDVDHHCCR